MRGLKENGFREVPTDGRIPAETRNNIVESFPGMKNGLASGDIEFEPIEYREFDNQGDRTTLTDFKFVEPARVTQDPFIEVYENVKGRTSSIVRRVVIRESQIDWIKFSLCRGINSPQALQCLKDLSEVLKKSPEEIYRNYQSALLSSFSDAIAYKNPVRKLEKIPMGATPAW